LRRRRMDEKIDKIFEKIVFAVAYMFFPNEPIPNTHFILIEQALENRGLKKEIQTIIEENKEDE
jgi:hypothetical protein